MSSSARWRRRGGLGPPRWTCSGWPWPGPAWSAHRRRDGGHLSVPGIISLGWPPAGLAGVHVSARPTGAASRLVGLVIAMLVAAVVVTPARAGQRERLAAPPGASSRPGRPSACCPRPSPTAWNSARCAGCRPGCSASGSAWSAVAALIGLALLGQHLTAAEWAAVGCVVAACIGAARSAPHAPHAPRSPQAPLYAEAPLPRAGRTQRHLPPYMDGCGGAGGDGARAGTGRAGRGTGGAGRGDGHEGDRARTGTGHRTRTGTERGQGRNADGTGQGRAGSRGSGAIVRSERAGRSRDSYDG